MMTIVEFLAEDDRGGRSSGLAWAHQVAIVASF
jgi:hypothetical protein